MCFYQYLARPNKKYVCFWKPILTVLTIEQGQTKQFVFSGNPILPVFSMAKQKNICLSGISILPVFSKAKQNKMCVSGNPILPVFSKASQKNMYMFEKNLVQSS